VTTRFVDVAAAVAALDIPGIDVLALSEMPPAMTGRKLPLLGPSSHDPSYLTDWQAVRVSLAGNYANTYTLNYMLYHAPAGKDRTVFALYPEMVANAQRVVNAFQALPRVDGCKRIELAGMPAFGPVHDASGAIYHGVSFALRVTEF
jgi:hypothetical protein